MAREYASACTAADFHGDYLSEQVNAKVGTPVSGFAQHVRLRRRIDTIWTLAALHRGLVGRNDPLKVEDGLVQLEDRFEFTGADPGAELHEMETAIIKALADRLQSRAADNTPGYLLLNPCSFTRRVALELDPTTGPLPLGGPLKAFPADADRSGLVVEVP